MRRKLTYSLMFLCLLALTGCLRRPLWVYTDEFRQVELITDWSLCDEYPDGMTAWFSNNDLSGRNRRITTAEVEHTWLNIPNGWWTGVVFDYSPAEYGSQNFLGMNRPDSCYVRCRHAEHQPMLDEDLYGGYAVPESMAMQIPTSPDTYMYLLSAEPDPMCADTLHNVHIITGVDGDLIPWKDMDTYGETLTVQTFYAFPQPITWKLRVFIELSGINYMFNVKATIAGLCDGNQLSKLRHTSEVCLHSLDTWEVKGRNTSKNTGTVGSTINTFGLPDTVTDYEHIPLQLNLQFLLRDEATIYNYHFVDPATAPASNPEGATVLTLPLKPEYITIFEDQRVIRIDIPLGLIDLPYVDAKDSAGFDATVSPWENGDVADVGM